MQDKEDLTGRTFVDWTVLGERTVKNQKSCWKCQCRCGTVKDVLANDLKRGKSKRCFNCGIVESFKEQRKCPLTQTFWHKFTQNARVRDLDIQVTKEEMYQKYLDQGERCAYTGLLIEFDTSSTKSDGTASIDRIDSTLPYTKENCQWVHKKVNTIKMNLTENDFLSICHLVSENTTKPEKLEVDNLKSPCRKYYNKRDKCKCGNLKLKTSNVCKECYLIK